MERFSKSDDLILAVLEEVYHFGHRFIRAPMTSLGQFESPFDIGESSIGS